MHPALALLTAASDTLLRQAWGLTTVASVGLRRELYRTLSPRGVAALLPELLRGRANMSLLYRFRAQTHPDAVALVQASEPGNERLEPPSTARRWTFAEANRIIDRVGLALRRHGIRPRDGVLLVLKNRAELLLVQAAIVRIGASAVPASWRSTAPELGHIAQHSSIRAAFLDASLGAVVTEATEASPELGAALRVAVGGRLEGLPTLDEFIAGEHGEVADASDQGVVVMYTSGTTGKPKGAVRGFAGSTLPGALAILDATGMQPGEVHVAACPLYHATAFAYANLALLVGDTAVILGDFRPTLFLDALAQYRATSAAVVPTMLHRTLELGEAAIAARGLWRLRGLLANGAPLGPALAGRVARAFGPCLYNCYGATELGIITVASPADLAAEPATIGRLLSGCAARIVDATGRACAVGEVGELWARGPVQVRGYHADQGATDEATRAGYFSVGDLARRDAQGFYFLEGRKRELIISGGVNVYPAEVEQALEAHPSVAEAAVVGVPDDAWGERVVAYVSLHEGQVATADELLALCRARLAAPKRPRELHFLARLPRNATGKVDRKGLGRAASPSNTSG